MGKIQKLPDIVASQVAAGEVVERPASVVKELVENSLDAGASQIEVEFRGGGSQFLSIQDNGVGMSAEDALMSLERHATSKIRSVEDLDHITSMGFRGEALPSIASVAKLRILTRQAESLHGTEVLVEGGKILQVRDEGAGVGTRIDVAELFFNVPARRKFLRSEATESGHILHILQQLALAHPATAFLCKKDGRVVWHLAQTRELGLRIRELLGEALLADLVQIAPLRGEGAQVHGFFARPGRARPDRSGQFLFVNGRAVVNPTMQRALTESCAGYIPKGQHPPAVLFLEIDPKLVDCNVHPAKREVRFRNPQAIRQLMARCAEAALEATRVPSPARPTAAPTSPAPESAAKPVTPAISSPVTLTPPAAELPPRAIKPSAPAQQLSLEAAEPLPPGENSPPVIPNRRTPSRNYQFLSALQPHYLLWQSDEGLVLLEVRAARQRILYEQWLKEFAAEQIPIQKLLLPVTLELPPREFAWLSGNMSFLQMAGLMLEPFGQSTIKIDGIPALLGDIEPVHLIRQLLSDLQANGMQAKGQHTRETLARSVAVMASQQTARWDSEEKANQLLTQLLECSLPYVCPQGKPTLVQISYQELQRKFGRAS